MKTKTIIFQNVPESQDECEETECKECGLYPIENCSEIMMFLSFDVQGDYPKRKVPKRRIYDIKHDWKKFMESQ